MFFHDKWNAVFFFILAHASLSQQWVENDEHQSSQVHFLKKVMRSHQFINEEPTRKSNFKFQERTFERFRKSLFRQSRNIDEDLYFLLNIQQCFPPVEPCPRWTSWIGSEPCTASCGGGKTTQRRYCKNERSNWKCSGSDTRLIICNSQPCPVWSAWATATECSQTCGSGQIIKRRTCSSSDAVCKGSDSKIESCFLRQCPPDWSDWSEFTPCSTSCGVRGVQTRSRRCLDTHGNVSINCTGESIQRYSCNMEITCPLKYSSWSSWTECDAECGKWTTKQRKRRCLTPPCSNDTLTENTFCGFKECLNATLNVNQFARSNDEDLMQSTHWGWSQWSGCNTSCGEDGVEIRAQNCSRLDSRLLCENRKSESRICRNAWFCPYWNLWSQWSVCQENCARNEGKRLRYRECVIKRFSNFSISPNEDQKQNIETVDNTMCGNGGTYQAERCSLLHCDSCWLDWSPWSQCSSSCGSGIAVSSRSRKVSVSFNCFGATQRYKNCSSPPLWSTWSGYSPCTTSCGEKGTQTRSRKCAGASLLHSSCEGNATETRRCNVEDCPLWSSWSSGSCSTSCGDGKKVYTRRCLQGKCGNETTLLRNCNQRWFCPKWSSWSWFSCCSASCGRGTMRRTRVCRFGNVGERGCEGNSEEERLCDLGPCNSTQHLPSPITCGRQALLSPAKTVPKLANIKIIGGVQSLSGKWPWQVSLQFNFCRRERTCWRHFCGGTLIASQWVISAVHCTHNLSISYDEPGDRISVLLGTINLTRKRNITRIFVSRIFAHPNYSDSFGIFSNDIELIQLAQSVQYTRNIAPACLPGTNVPTPGNTCYITGWGRITPGSSGKKSNRLREAAIEVRRCHDLSNEYQSLSEKRHMCAGDPLTARSDTCKGDSGGPLVCVGQNGNWFLAGVTSFGFAFCGTRGHVGVYAPVHRYQNWVRSKMKTCSRIDF